jgi:hypothetical protein
MATETRSGFRLPWGPGQDEPTDDTATIPESVSEEAEEPAMIEAADTPDVSPASNEPTADAAAERQPRRATKFMADLSRAMLAAAENARAETMARFEVEAKGVVEAIHATATDEAADLRRKADDDVAAIREWSKAEIARIREETEGRITARKSGLDGEMEQHAATIETRIERVTAVVATFETQMQSFFERLNAEEDPTRIATMAETMPDPPSLADVAAAVATGLGVATPVSEAGPTAVSEAPAQPSVDLFGESAEPTPASDFDFAAAEAEAASFSGDLESEPELSEPEATADDADAPTLADVEPTADAELASSKVIVSGLVSVANIANFKRSLSRTSGISTIAVASGPEGDFIFTVGHTLGTALTAAVQALPGFEIDVTGETDDAIHVAAQDRDATD